MLRGEANNMAGPETLGNDNETPDIQKLKIDAEAPPAEGDISNNAQNDEDVDNDSAYDEDTDMADWNKRNSMPPTELREYVS